MILLLRGLRRARAPLYLRFNGVEPILELLEVAFPRHLELGHNEVVCNVEIESERSDLILIAVQPSIIYAYKR